MKPKIVDPLDHLVRDLRQTDLPPRWHMWITAFLIGAFLAGISAPFLGVGPQ